VGGVRLERQVAELVDDEELRLGVEPSLSSRRPSAWARASMVMSAVAWTKSTE
jgi:hypothetical protein